ncbi:MAG: hypothetical protein U9R07_14065 [Pseudomonadota bacterium]|nr:hypothetical protein [Pseudomonadota bacterium]
MSVQYDVTPRSVADGSNIATTLGAASLGGTIGVRVIVDDAVLTTKEQAIMALEIAFDRIVKQTWPAS